MAAGYHGLYSSLAAKAAAAVFQSLSTLAVVSCTMPARPMIEIFQNNDDGLVEIGVGETFAITLSENATTGFRWAPDEIDRTYVELLSSRPDYRMGAIGSGGSVTFTLRGVKVGETSIVLKNWREWEGDASVVDRFQVTVRINP